MVTWANVTCFERDVELRRPLIKANWQLPANIERSAMKIIQYIGIPIAFAMFAPFILLLGIMRLAQATSHLQNTNKKRR
jgi:hypothetical protein